MTLVILAAGMGSRYGGLKQLDPITPNGEFIIDFSIYDAVNAGFDRIVFIIKKENYEIFKETIGNRIAPFVKVEYAFQALDMLPEGFSLPETRKKPWGTAHAVLCCKNLINDAFAVINADDFYGRDAFVQMAQKLRNAEAHEYCMAGYILENTLTENGSVARGVCTTENSMLVSIEEHTKIRRDGDTAVCECSDTPHKIDLKSIVSMNFFGFTPDVFEIFEKDFIKFLKDNINTEKAEFFIPLALDSAMKSKKCSVSVFPTDARWFGVTYAADKPSVVAEIAKMTAQKIYPDGLWKD